MASIVTSFAKAPRFVRFVALGGVAALANWSSRFLWSMFLSFELAVAAAYATGMIIAFHLFRTYVFSSDRPLAEQVSNFCLVNLIGMVVTVSVAHLLVTIIFPNIGMRLFPTAIGHAIAVLTPISTSWLGHRLLTFR